MTDELFNHIIERLLDNANDTLEDVAAEPGCEFFDGKKLAYYEVLDTIRNDLITADYDLSSCGLDIDIDKKYM